MPLKQWKQGRHKWTPLAHAWSANCLCGLKRQEIEHKTHEQQETNKKQEKYECKTEKECRVKGKNS
jgi:hypothetical protein